MISDPDLRIAELLAARLCHELVGPITAVANGAELLCEAGLEGDPEALAVIGESAQRAGSRLQFYRFAYGFGGEGQTAGPSPGELAAGYFAASPIACRYGEMVRCLPLIQQKLACNLLVLGAEALVRGGRIAVDVGAGGIRVEAAGDGVTLAHEQSAALRMTTPVAALTSRTVHGYFTGRLARAQGCRLVDELAPGRLCIGSISAAR